MKTDVRELPLIPRDVTAVFWSNRPPFPRLAQSVKRLLTVNIDGVGYFPVASRVVYCRWCGGLAQC